MKPETKSKNSKNKFFKYSRKTTAVVSLGALIVIFGGTSAFAAHSNALPGSPLYPLKQVWEQGQMLLSFDSASKATMHVKIAQDRIQALQATPTPTPALVPALQTVQANLNSALDQSKNVPDQTKRTEIRKSISDAAVEAEKEAQQKTEAASSSDQQDAQSSSDAIKSVGDQASTDD